MSLFDYADPASFVSRLRRRRSAHLRIIIEQIYPCRILDVGGEAQYWINAFGVGWLRERLVHVTLLNHTTEYVGADLDPSVFCVVVADGCALPYPARSFDLVHSNSVIEHVGCRVRRIAFVRELRRVGRWFYLQTPARCFPLEAHTRFPLFQYLPSAARVWLFQHCRLGTYPKLSAERARAFDQELQLLTARELAGLFPAVTIRRERLCGLTKSYMVYGVC